MFWLYNGLWLLAFPGILGYFLLRCLLTGKYRRNLGPRLGLGLSARVKKINRRVIWVHALSVGEVLSAVSLVYSLRKQYPEYELFFTTTSETGQQVARQRLASLNCRFYYLPLDLWWVVRRAVKNIGASLFVLVETDLWPNLFWSLAREGTPIVLANGKVSDRSFPRYRLGRRFVSELFNHIDALCMQSEEDGRRMRILGVEDSKVKVTGNMKFDQPLSKSVGNERDQLIKELGWIPPSPKYQISIIALFNFKSSGIILTPLGYHFLRINVKVSLFTVLIIYLVYSLLVRLSKIFAVLISLVSCVKYLLINPAIYST